MRSNLLAFVLLACTAHGQVSTVLFIGNSYTTENDLPNTFRQLALSLGDTVITDVSAPGGFRFDQHFEYAPTLDAISSRQWDAVVLQEQSQIPAVNPSNTALAVSLGSARLLVERIKQNRECTLPVFYMTWGRENGDEEQCPSWPPVCTYDGMQALLRERYLLMNEANFGRCAAVGVAWKSLREQRPDIDLYQTDGSHPTVNGTYLAACVHYCTIFQASCVGASFHGTVQPEIALALQQIASATVMDNADTWRLYGSPGLTAMPTGSELENPSIVSFYHPGLGEHLWTCSDGQTSTSATPFFDLEPGIYEFAHMYTDLCGYTETWNWTQVVWHVDQVGIEEPSTPTFTITAVGSGMLDVETEHPSARLMLYDPRGRLVRSERIRSGRTRFDCPHGMLAWIVEFGVGERRRGKILVP